MSVLAEICARKLEHVAKKKAALSLHDLKNKIQLLPPPAGFINALRAYPGTAIIAEVKKASPSKGIIRDNFNPVEIAQIYETHGAACLSVLTDEPYFQGHDDYLAAIKSTVSLPVLRKDFILDLYQIYESRALGADCVLLIMAALEDGQARELYDAASSLNMDVLVEVHDAQELERAVALKPRMIGVNNRSLKTLKVDIATSHELIAHIPQNILKVAESGIESAATIHTLQKAGFQAFLIGESLMKQADIGQALERLLQK